jgi:hypothetical protein
MTKINRKKRTFCTAESVEPRTLFATINFAAHTDFAVGTSPVALVAGDFNGDGDEDLAVADNVTDKVYVYFGQGNGSFVAGPILSLNAPATSIISGDFNGDGKPDIAVACTAALGQSTTTVDVFLNTGAGTFGTGQITTVETGAVAGENVALVAADFNRDVHLDLAVTDYTNDSLSILDGNGNGTFAAPVTYNLPGQPTAVTETDFNNDTYPDLAVTTTSTDNSTGVAVTTNNVNILLGNSTGDFSAGPQIQLNSVGIPNDIATANLTGANTPGLVVGDSNGNATLITNTSGTFAVATVNALSAGSSGIATADFDLDGNTDIVSADGGSSTSITTDSVTVLQGSGNGNVANTYQFSVGVVPEDVVVADFNNDGKPDIATANKGGTVSILLNTTALAPIVTKTTLVPSATSSPAGSNLTLTATITTASVSPLTGEEVPTGTVNFYDGTTLLSTVTLTSASNVAVFSTSSLALGSNTLRAKYLGDDAYAASTSAAVVETITPTSTEGPDLLGTLVSSTFPAIVAPGETGTVSVRVTNQGNTIASGSITNAVYLSLDTLLDGGDTAVTIHGALARANLHLQPNKSEVLTGTITIPQSAALADDYLLISLNTTDSLPESVTTNNLVVSPTTYAVSDVFGTVDGRKSVALQVADNNGTVGTFHLTGPGFGTVNVGDSGVDLILTGTTAASAVTVTTPRGTVFQMTSISAASTVGKLTAPTVAVSSGSDFSSGLTSAALSSIGGNFNIGGRTISSLTLGQIASANLTTTGGIHSLAVTTWGSGTITAPWIGTLTSRQGFAASMALSGAGSPGGVTLNAATIGGTLGSSSTNWAITGTINRLTAGAFASGWLLNDTNGSFGSFGLIKSLSSTGTFDSTINASSIGSISIRGAVTGATFNATTSIGSIVIHGPVDSTTRFISPVFPRKPIVDGVAIDPTTDPRFES